MRSFIIRIISITMMAALIFAFLPASGNQSLYVANAYTYHSQADAVSWAKGMADSHWAIKDGSHQTQCVEFIWQYYEWFLGYHVQGNGYDYLSDTYGACPYNEGWSRPATNTVQPGDIVIWDKNAKFREDGTDYCLDAGHIGVVISVNGNTMITVEANAGENYGDEKGVCGYKYNREVSCISGLIRPNFKCNSHKWDSGKVTKKPSCKNQQDGEKIFSCTVCGETKTESIPWSHNYKSIVTVKATFLADGVKGVECSACGDAKKETIYKPETIELSKTSCTYTGKKNRPAAIVKDRNGNIIASKYYTLSYSNNVKIGKAYATVKFKGDYSGTKKLNFNIVPKGTTITKCTGGNKCINVSWKKVQQIDGYQIQYATIQDFSDNKATTVKGSKSLSKTIKNLSTDATYYVRVRTYKTVKKKKYYSKWSNVLSVKTNSATSEDLYQLVIKEYRSLLKEISSGHAIDPHTIEDNYKYVYWEIAESAYRDGIYPEYAICDLNNDGVDELIIGGYNYGKYFIGSIFTLNNSNNPVSLINCNSYMYRGKITIYNDGQIENDGSSGADYHEWKFYIIDGSKAKLVLKEDYLMNGNSMTLNGKEMSEDGFFEAIRKKESSNKKSLSWSDF